jgi:hypothetical protein
MKQAKYQCVENPKVIVYHSVKVAKKQRPGGLMVTSITVSAGLAPTLKSIRRFSDKAFAEYFKAGSLYKLYNEVRHPMLIRKLAEFRRQGFRVANVKPDTLFFYFQSVKKDKPIEAFILQLTHSQMQGHIVVSRAGWAAGRYKNMLK